MQLIADLVLWLSLVVYLIYVWDESGTTLERLNELVVRGGEVGSITPGAGANHRRHPRFRGTFDRHRLDQTLDRPALVAAHRHGTRCPRSVDHVVWVCRLCRRTAHRLEASRVWISAAWPSPPRALALGIGFGLQEIANNFVSGLILLFERPIRTGDFVTVGEIEGFVRKISIRATEIETLDNQNVLVPNSELVSGRVTNWVLRDPYGRLRVTVGVAYGSEIALVRDILEQVAREHSEVITDGRAPAPRALFMGFGDSSLDFELRCRINRIERRFTVTSDLNFAIDREFREAGITVPFPQRDLHVVSYPDAASAALEEPEARDAKTIHLRKPCARARSLTRKASRASSD